MKFECENEKDIAAINFRRVDETMHMSFEDRFLYYRSSESRSKYEVSSENFYQIEEALQYFRERSPLKHIDRIWRIYLVYYLPLKSYRDNSRLKLDIWFQRFLVVQGYRQTFQRYSRTRNPLRKDGEHIAFEHHPFLMTNGYVKQYNILPLDPVSDQEKKV